MSLGKFLFYSCLLAALYVSVLLNRGIVRRFAFRLVDQVDDRLFQPALPLDDGGKLPISVVMVDWKTPQTLEDSLETYQKNRLFDMVIDSYLYVQEIDLYSRSTLDKIRQQKIPIKTILGSLTNTYIHGAISALFDIATQPYVLLLEKDFQLVEPSWKTFATLRNAIELMRAEGIHAVRMKSRRAPGAREFARAIVRGDNQEHTLFNGTGQDYYNRDLVCQTLYWLDDTQFDHFLNRTKGLHSGIYRCGNNGDSWCFPPHLCHWTNQAVLVDRRWWRRQMAKGVRFLEPNDDSEYQKHHALEIAARYGYKGVNWLTGSSLPAVAVSPGLFSHRDMEKYPYDIRVDDDNNY
jgi:hypothetical protein